MSLHIYPFTGKWCNLTWPHEGPKLNLHHLREISMVLKMTVLTPILGILEILGIMLLLNSCNTRKSSLLTQLFILESSIDLFYETEKDTDLSEKELDETDNRLFLFFVRFSTRPRNTFFSKVSLLVLGGVVLFFLRQGFCEVNHGSPAVFCRTPGIFAVISDFGKVRSSDNFDAEAIF